MILYCFSALKNQQKTAALETTH